ncbi:hypothetical protein ACFCV3_42010 [Kribbella sp. NPDC056345]|uniref:hypothetical protein n=1 Tax=Kribbella sp. NPDC056345 TaxID=3345789 RepID=UPI0035D7756E
MTRDEPYRLLRAAGAPALPDGYWYRVRLRKYSDHLVDIEVRCDREFLGSLALGRSTFSIVANGKRTVLEAAARAARRAFEAATGAGVKA